MFMSTHAQMISRDCIRQYWFPALTGVTIHVPWTELVHRQVPESRKKDNN